jgi:hypothetical protein
MSRRQITKRRALLLPSRIADWPQTRIIIGSSVRPALVAPVTCMVDEPPPCSTCTNIHDLAERQNIPTTAADGHDFAGAKHLFARLAFQQIRPCNRPELGGAQRCSTDDPQRGGEPAVVSDVRSLITGRPVTATAAPESVPAAVETLFVQLARRRLRSRTTKDMS